MLKDANSIVEPPFPLCGQSLGPLVSQMVATSTCKQLNRCQVGVSENVVYPIVPNGFHDHYPYEKWLAIIGNINPTFSDKAKYQGTMVDLTGFNDYINAEVNQYTKGVNVSGSPSAALLPLQQ